MRILSSVLAFVFCGFMAGLTLVLLGDATGWLSAHGSTTGPVWWRVAYLCIVVIGTPAIATACARAAWRSGAR